MSRLYRKLGRACCSLMLGLLIFQGCNSTKRGKWKLVHQEGFPHSAEVEAIAFNNNQEGWALNWAELDKVYDAGKTWTPVLTNLSGERAFYSFIFTTAKVGFVVGTQQKGNGHSILILQTSDGGLSWREKSTNARTESDRYKTLQLNSISFCGENSGWAAGSDLVLHTADSGQTWQTQQINVNGDDRLFSIAARAPNVLGS